jgi:hypothetical protein
LQGNFILRADYAGYKEKQRALLFQIPVMLQFQAPLDKQFFYARAGVKLGFPVSATYNQSSVSIITAGYSDYSGLLYERMPNHGFDTYKSTKSSSDLDLGMACMFSLESGIKWKLSEKNTLYTGIYFDYGLNNRKESKQELLAYDATSPTVYQYNSFLHSHSENKPLVDKVAPLAIGIQLKLTFGKGKKLTNPRR